MKNWKSAILKSCMLLAAVFLIGAAVPASAKTAPKLSSKKITLKVGQKKKLKVKNVKKKKVKWSSKKKAVATVNKKGVVKAKKKGKTTIIAKVGKKKLKCKVVVKKADTKKKSNGKNKGNNKISKAVEKELPSAKQYRVLNGPETMAVGKPANLFDYVYYAGKRINAPSNEAKVKGYKWTSSNNSIVSIDKYGVATPQKEGKVNLSFKYLDRSGEWRESNTLKAEVVNVGDVSYTVSFGLNRDLLNMDSKYLELNLPRYNSPDAFNYINVTVTNNSDTKIFVSKKFGIQTGGWDDWPTRDNQDVEIPAKSSKTIWYGFTEKGGVELQKDIYRTSLTYSINGKDALIYYYPETGIYEVSK